MDRVKDSVDKEIHANGPNELIDSNIFWNFVSFFVVVYRLDFAVWFGHFCDCNVWLFQFDTYHFVYVLLFPFFFHLMYNLCVTCYLHIKNHDNNFAVKRSNRSSFSSPRVFSSIIHVCLFNEVTMMRWCLSQLVDWSPELRNRWVSYSRESMVKSGVISAFFCHSHRIKV